MSLEISFTFLLVKETTWKRILNSNSELSQNCTEKQIMPLKTIANCLFNDIWCYLVLACFYWKIGVFQYSVVRVYYSLKQHLRLTQHYKWWRIYQLCEAQFIQKLSNTAAELKSCVAYKKASICADNLKFYNIVFELHLRTSTWR